MSNNTSISRDSEKLLSEMDYKYPQCAKVCYNCAYFVFNDGGDPSEECHYARKKNIGIVLNVSSYGSCKHFT